MDPLIAEMLMYVLFPHIRRPFSSEEENLIRVPHDHAVRIHKVRIADTDVCDFLDLWLDIISIAMVFSSFSSIFICTVYSDTLPMPVQNVENLSFIIL